MHKYISLFGYYGAKFNLLDDILPKLRRCPNYEKLQYREPFFGSGKVGLNFLRPGMSAWLNDKDRSLACLWTSIIRYPDAICRMMTDKPTEKTFYLYQGRLDAAPDPLNAPPSEVCRAGYERWYVQNLCFQGRPDNYSQSRKKKWRPILFSKLIAFFHHWFSQRRIYENAVSALPFECLFYGTTDVPCLIYLDPPYIDHEHEYRMADGGLHERLAERLMETNAPWLLSYNNHHNVLDLYQGWALGVYLYAYYHSNKTNKRELLISNSHQMLDRGRVIR